MERELGQRILKIIFNRYSYTRTNDFSLSLDNIMTRQQSSGLRIFLCLLWLAAASAWVTTTPPQFGTRSTFPSTTLFADTAASTETATTSPEEQPEVVYDYTVPDDAVVMIQPAAMKRLRELRASALKDPVSETLTLRMGVRSGGCSGMSYVMDIVPVDKNVIAEDDAVDDYPDDKIQCVVDAKSMLYLYGMELDYSTELIGGGFKFYNPNAGESCGCGSSFGV
jgi:iron-sulfur cluster assembly accessory protein